MSQRLDIKDKISKAQLDALAANCKEFGIELVDMFNENNGIVHMVGPEQGLTQPGKTVVCGDSHTATHGAFGAIAFGMGQVRLNTCWQRRQFRQKNLKQWELKLLENCRKVCMQKILFYI